MAVDIKTRNLLKIFLILLITGIIFLILFSNININEVISLILNANKFYLLLSLIPMGVSLFFIAVRWQIILNTMGYELNLVDCFKIFMAALPLSSITPSKSGDIIRAYYLKNTIPMTKTAGSVITERVFDLFVLILFSLIGIWFYGKYEFFILSIFVLSILAIIVLFAYKGIKIPVSKSWNEKIQSISHSMKMILYNKWALCSVMSYSLIIWFCAVIQTLLFFYALNINIPVLYVLGNIPIAIFIGMIPVTIGGMGTRDAAIIYLFAPYGSPSQLLGVGLLFSLFRYWLLAIVGLIFMRSILKKTTIS